MYELSMSKQSFSPRFSYGDTLIVKKNLPSYLHPGEIVSVCSIFEMDSAGSNQCYGIQAPVWVYTVEFGNGSSIELPEHFLEIYAPAPQV